MLRTGRSPNTATRSRFCNDDIAETVRKYPKRFVGLGTLPMQDPELAVRELDRCVSELGFRGVQIGSNVNQTNLNAEALLPVFRRAEELGAAVFVHPWEMFGRNELTQYWMPWLVGMPAETTRAIVSLIFGGVLEKLPKLRLCFAHGGGSFPATIGRIEQSFRCRPDLCAIHNPVNPRGTSGIVVRLARSRCGPCSTSSTDGLGPHRARQRLPVPLGETRPGETHPLDEPAARFQEDLSSAPRVRGGGESAGSVRVVPWVAMGSPQASGRAESARPGQRDGPVSAASSHATPGPRFPSAGGPTSPRSPLDPHGLQPNAYQAFRRRGGRGSFSRRGLHARHARGPGGSKCATARQSRSRRTATERTPSVEAIHHHRTLLRSPQWNCRCPITVMFPRVGAAVRAVSGSPRM